jgi:nitroreductase
MEVAKAIKERRSIRQFTDKNIPDDIVKKIVEAGRWAPSPKNTQPWRFIIIRDTKKLIEISEYARYSPYLKDVPLGIAIIVSPIEAYDWYDELQENKYAAACAAQNMMLQAWDMGIGSCWVSVDREKVAELLDVPEELFLLCVMAFGYPTKEPPKPDEEKRIPAGGLTMRETYLPG